MLDSPPFIVVFLVRCSLNDAYISLRRATAVRFTEAEVAKLRESGAFGPTTEEAAAALAARSRQR